MGKPCPPFCGLEAVSGDPLLLMMAGVGLAILLGVVLWKRLHP